MILIYLAVWMRPEITEICFMGINRLRESGYPIDALAVISEESMIPLCEKYDIMYCMYKNQPLGEKLNYGLSQALKLSWDYLIGIGSDDLLKNELIDKYLERDKPVIAMDNALFLNSETGGCRWVKSNSLFGAGRCYSRKIFDKVDRIWSKQISKRLDKESMFYLATHGVFETRLKSDKPLIIDIKSKESIWDFNAVRTLGEKYPFDLAVEGLSAREITAIKQLQYVAA